MREMSGPECRFHEDEEQEQEAKQQQQQQPIYCTLSTMTISGPRLYHPTRCPIGLPQKGPRDRFRTVTPSTGVVGEGFSVGGQASLQKYTNKDAALDFSGGIGMAQASVITDSGKATSSPETRVNNGDESINKATAQKAKSTKQKRYRGVRKKPCGEWVAAIRDPSTGAKLSLGTFDTAEKAAAAYKEAACGFKVSQAKLNLPQEVRQRDGNAHRPRRRTLARESQHLGAPGHSNPMTETSSTMSLISQHFPGFHLYVHLLQTPGLSSLPLIQQCLAMTLSSPSLQEPTSSTVLSRPTETVPAVSASALQDPILTKPPNPYIYSNVSGSAAEEYFKRL